MSRRRLKVSPSYLSHSIVENAPSARHAASQEFEAWSRAIRFGLLLLAFALLHAPSLAYGQTTSSTRQGRLLGAELRVSPYLGRAVPTASLLFYSGSRDVSFGGELSVTLRSITDQRPNGYRRMGPLVRIGPSVGYAGLLSKQTGYYTAFALLVGDHQN